MFRHPTMKYDTSSAQMLEVPLELSTSWWMRSQAILVSVSLPCLIMLAQWITQ